MNIRSLTLLLAISLMTSGCATIVSGPTQPLRFNSNPDGATVAVNGNIIGKTPLTTTLKRGSSQTLLFQKEGYKDLSMPLKARMNSWFWGNILIGGFLGSTTDNVSGAMNEYAPSQYMATLQPNGSGSLVENVTLLAQRQKVKDFIVVGYQPLKEDLRAGKGEYLDSLLVMLKVAPDKRNEATSKIKSFSEFYDDVPDFAGRVAGFFVREKGEE